MSSGKSRDTLTNLMHQGDISVEVQSRYQERKTIFEKEAKRIGRKEMLNYIWYHTIDLGGGLITPGVYDFRKSWAVFGFPQDLQGKTVLDIGSASGFFAFEFEKRGARVTSVELPSLEKLDRFPGQTTDQLLSKLRRMQFPRADLGDSKAGEKYSSRKLYQLLLDGPFTTCQKILKSRVRRCYSSIYDLSLKRLGVREPFDLVFLGDILIHTISPMHALAAVAPLCKKQLIITQVMDVDSGKPAMEYVGGTTADDEISWWRPNKAMFIEVLKKLGFARVEQTGTNEGYLQHEGYWFERPVLQAWKQESEVH